MSRKYISILLALLALTACRSMRESIAEIPRYAPEVKLVGKAEINARSAPFDISFADVINDFLVLHLSYSGGCEDHDFEVITQGKYSSHYPPEIVLHVKHHDNGDHCRGIIDEKRYFDLTGLQYPGTNRIRLVFARSNKILDYTY